MSKEIAFRAWDKEKKKMLFMSDGDFSNNHIWWLETNDCQDRFDIMQFTSLNDKNGEEVYQDDLMKDLLHIYRVVWQKFSARFLLIDVKEPMNQLSGEAIKLLRKIGNIHQNPKLMEQNNA